MRREYVTKPRLLIADILRENRNKCFTAADVYALLEKREEGINRATVYRNLDKLTEDGDLMRFRTVDSQSNVYQYVEDKKNCHGHLHMQCKECGSIMHLECSFMKEITEHLLSHHQFAIECEGSVIMGICNACRS